MFGKFVDEYVRRFRYILGCWIHGTRATETSRRGGSFRSRTRFSRISIGCTSATWSSDLVLPIFLHAVADWSRLSILYHGRFHHGDGEKKLIVTFFYQFKGLGGFQRLKTGIFLLFLFLYIQ